MDRGRCERMRTKSPVSPESVNPLPRPQNESEFRDKLSPIHIALNFSLDPQAPVDSHGLRPVLHYQSKSRIEDKVRAGWGDGPGGEGPGPLGVGPWRGEPTA